MENQPEDFIKVMEGLVSNDSNKRIKNLSELNKIIVDVINRDLDYKDLFSKIWKSLFYRIYNFNQVFWNTDKPINQKLTADDIAFKLEIFQDKKLIVDYVNCFLTEFGKKWPKIDFLRLDKYIMMLQTVMKKFFDICLEIKTLENISSVIEHMKTIVCSEFYNFSFTFNVLKCFSHLIEILFDKGILDEIKFKGFSQNMIELFLNTKDNREIDSFKENIMKKLSEKVRIYPNLKEVLLKTLYEKASSKEDFPENKRKLLFKFYKHLKYILINEETGDIEDFPIDDEKPIDQVDPVNAVTLKTKYTNLNIARSLKKRIINSVIKHNKRADKILREWQQKEMENNKEGENKEKIKDEIVETVESQNKIDKILENKEKINTEMNNEFNQINDQIITKNGSYINEKEEIQQNESKNHILNNLEEKQTIEVKPKKNNKKKQINLKNKSKEDSKDNEFDDDFDEFVENVKMNLKAGIKDEEELIKTINNSFIPKKRKNVQSLEKGINKKAKPNDNQNINNANNKSMKKVTFNLAENLITKYDLQKPITLSSNKTLISDNSNKNFKGVLKNPKKMNKNKSVSF